VEEIFFGTGMTLGGKVGGGPFKKIEMEQCFRGETDPPRDGAWATIFFDPRRSEAENEVFLAQALKTDRIPYRYGSS
jgi:hypothetical protein